MWYTGETRKSQKRFIFKCFVCFLIKVRFSIQQILQQVPSVKFKLCLTKQGRHQPERNVVGWRPHQDVCHDIGICSTYWNLQTSEEGKTLAIKHQTKKESQMVLCVFHFQSPWLVFPQNVYTVAFVYLLSFLQDLCSGIMLVQFKLCASFLWKWCSESMRKP